MCLKSLTTLFLLLGAEKSGYAVEPHVLVWVTFVYVKLLVIVEPIDIVFVLHLYQFSFVSNILFLQANLFHNKVVIFF